MHRMGDRMMNMACIRSLWCHDVGRLPLTMASRHDGVSGAHRPGSGEKAPRPGNPMRRFQLPLLGSNQDSPDPEGPM